jgi:hypothetical protein
MAKRTERAFTREFKAEAVWWSRRAGRPAPALVDGDPRLLVTLRRALNDARAYHGLSQRRIRGSMSRHAKWWGLFSGNLTRGTVMLGCSRGGPARRRKRPTDEQVIGILKEAGAGRKTTELCHRDEDLRADAFNGERQVWRSRSQ